MRHRPVILVVDDTPETLSFLVQLLSTKGYDAHGATSGEDGLKGALALRPDLILLDLRMRDLDGLEVCRRLKAQEETREVPIILVSAFAEVEEWVAGLELGAADYVNKPFHIAELLARVRTQLSLGRTLALLKDKNAVIERANEQLHAEVDARQAVEVKLRHSLALADRARGALLNALEDEKRAEGEMQRANAFLDSIIENIPDMVLITDARDLSIVRINRAGEALLGIPRAELLGRTAGQVLPKPHADAFESVDRAVIASRAPVEARDEPILTPHGIRILHTTKVPILDAEGHALYILGISIDITDAKRAQDEILALSGRLRDILATVPEILMEVDNDFVYTWANAAGLKFFGDEVTGRPAAQYLASGQSCAETAQALERGEEATYFENVQRRKDGASRVLAWWSRPLKGVDGKVRGALLSARDVTEARKADEEKRRLEEQLRASQRMEAIGSLAGGVAHDFNNLLCVLQSYTEFALSGLRSNDPVREDLLAIKRASERAAVLIRQLLAFGRRQVLQPVPLSLNDVVGGMAKMLRRILGEDVEFSLVLAEDLGVVRADRGQIEEVLMNLAANARDAMPAGGRLVVETCNLDIGVNFSEVQGTLPAGPYVQVAVTDSGCGMDDHTMSHIFEPFFSTKEKGKGTGLGLPTVYGIVKQSAGGIWVASEVGKGSTFKVYLPRVAAALPAAVVVSDGEGRIGGNETILLVEDEDDLRHVARRALETAGYTVLTACDGIEAMTVAEQYSGRIDLLLTDVVMPRLGGRLLGQRMVQVRPSVVILYMSGYTDDAIIQHGLLDAEIQLIGKPFTASALTQKVREVLDRSAAPERRSSHGSGAGLVPPRASEGAEAEAGQALPEYLVSELRKATSAARYDEIATIISSIADAEPAMGAILRQRLDDFDYEGINRLLNGNARRGAS